MFVLVGTRDKLKKDIWAGRGICPSCGRESNFHLARLIQTITLFFIPIIPITTKRYLVCDSCEWAKELSGKEYREAKRKQMALLENGELPEDVIRNDFSPANLNFSMQTIKLVVTGMWAAFMALWMVGMLIEVISDGASIGETVLSLLFLLVMTGWAFFLPFILSLKNYIIKRKMKKAFQALDDQNANMSY